MPSGSLYATWDDVRQYMEDIPSSASAVIEAISLRVSRAIDMVVGWPFYDLGSASRYFDGTGTAILTFDYPLRSPSSITLNTGSLTRNIDYYLYPANSSPYWYAVRSGAGTGEQGLVGALPQVSKSWWRNAENTLSTWGTSPLGVVVCGSWGYDTPPDPIVEATIETTIRLWKARDQGFVDVVGTEGITSRAISRSFLPMTKEILENYRNARHHFA